MHRNFRTYNEEFTVRQHCSTTRSTPTPAKQKCFKVYCLYSSLNSNEQPKRQVFRNKVHRTYNIQYTIYTKYVSVKTQLYLDNGFYVSKKATCIQNISVKTQLYLDNGFYVSKKATCIQNLYQSKHSYI
jgi:hypothetical protein